MARSVLSTRGPKSGAPCLPCPVFAALIFAFILAAYNLRKFLFLFFFHFSRICAKMCIDLSYTFWSLLLPIVCLFSSFKLSHNFHVLYLGSLDVESRRRHT